MASGPNLITGDSSTFEGGTTGGWGVYSSSTVANSTAQAHTGSHSLAMTATSTAPPSCAYGGIPVPGGRNYNVGLWTYTTVTLTTVQLSVYFLDANNNLLDASHATFVSPPQNAWTQLIYPLSPPSNSYFFSLIVIITNPATASNVYYFDDFSIIQQGATPAFANWRMNSLSFSGLPQQTVRERTLSVLASYVTGQNPDGTIRGT